jgi:hypothetical protein
MRLARLDPARLGRGGAGRGWGGAGTLPRVGEAQVREDLPDDDGVVEDSDQAQAAPTMDTRQNINSEGSSFILHLLHTGDVLGVERGGVARSAGVGRPWLPRSI